MIKNFGDKETEALAKGQRTRFPQDVVPRAKRAIFQIDDAKEIFDLRLPPSNRLEKLRGDLVGYWSIRINDQWRVIFLWKPETGDAYRVRIVDYH